MMVLPEPLRAALACADSSWIPVLEHGLAAVHAADPAYLPTLATDDYLPTEGRMFAAFMQPLERVRYVLIGEGPYPRPQSATGVCFMDGAVESLWSPAGLSKQVNRATSLRNFVKMLLVADGLLREDETTGVAMASVSARARAIGSPFIQTLTELQANLGRHGFLLLNASLVYRPHVAPLKDAKAWRPFLAAVLEAMAACGTPPPMLVLWGKIAGQLQEIEAAGRLPAVAAEHPYNLSFINNRAMHALFGPMRLLFRQS
jgi:uracil-DNA glycosylase